MFIVLMNSLMQGNGQLVGARRALVTATNALQLADDRIGLHAAHKGGNALQVAVAAARELHVVDDAIVGHLNVDLGRTSSLRIISITHDY